MQNVQLGARNTPLSYESLQQLPEQDRKKIAGLLLRVGNNNPNDPNYLRLQLKNITQYQMRNDTTVPPLEEKSNIDHLLLKVDRCSYNPHSRNLILTFVPADQRSYFFHGALNIKSRFEMVAISRQFAPGNRALLERISNLVAYNQRGFHIHGNSDRNLMSARVKATIVSKEECEELGKRYGHGPEGFLMVDRTGLNSRSLTDHSEAAGVLRGQLRWKASSNGLVANDRIKDVQEVEVEVSLDVMARAFPFQVPQEEPEVETVTTQVSSETSRQTEVESSEISSTEVEKEIEESGKKEQVTLEHEPEKEKVKAKEESEKEKVKAKEESEKDEAKVEQKLEKEEVTLEPKSEKKDEADRVEKE